MWGDRSVDHTIEFVGDFLAALGSGVLVPEGGHVRRVTDGCHEFAQGDVGIARDHGGGMLPEVLGTYAFDADNRTGGGPRVGQILAAGGEPGGSGEDEGVGRRCHVVLEG